MSSESEIQAAIREDEINHKRDCVMHLEAALNEIYALYGEDPEIERITQDAVSKYGLG